MELEFDAAKERERDIERGREGGREREPPCNYEYSG